MVNNRVFKTESPKKGGHNTTNEAGGKAFSKSAEEALASYACTGTIADTFYASAEDQYDKIIELLNKCDPYFIAQVAVYARTSGYMKDMPALLMAYLFSINYHNTSVEAKQVTINAFQASIDNVKMLRNFVQIIRSGKLGRKSFGSLAKKLIKSKIANMSDDALFRSDIGQNPSLSDIIKMVHPSPLDNPSGQNGRASRDALLSYIIGKDKDPENLPPLIKAYEAFKKDGTNPIPEVPFQRLGNLNLTDKNWATIFETSGYMMTLMNLNTANRHNVFKAPEMVSKVANRLADSVELSKAKVFPYKLYTAWKYAENIPNEVRDALYSACDNACKNLPKFNGRIAIAIDGSGSMSSPVTGNNGNTPASKISCLEAAAFFGAALISQNSNTDVYIFSGKPTKVITSHRDSIFTNMEKIVKASDGGVTNAASVLHTINTNHTKYDAVIYISDGQTWAEYTGNYPSYWGHATTNTNIQQEWHKFKKSNKNSKLVLIDIQPNASRQAKTDPDTLSVGGFSDSVFSVVSSFLETSDKNHWVNVIKNIKL